ncbi:tyrosine-type recombinase/integrase [Paenibacillus mucilaginosus]|uniref:tyrosine-type recombinase/integrase n=1 Tax=Paenibacillus mucilaginosus TaxID=61624 RepID=UPI003D232AB4
MNELILSFKEKMESVGEIAPTTIRQYVSEVGKFAKWFEVYNQEPFILENITSRDIASFKRQMVTEKKSPRSINTFVYAIKKFCRWAVEEGRMPDDPAAGIEPVTVEFIRDPKWLDRLEEHRFMREVEKERNSRNLAIVELMRQAGLRREEICQLRVSDLVYKDRVGEAHIRKGKGDKPRVVPLNKTVIDALKKYEEEYKPVDYYFYSQKSKPGKEDGWADDRPALAVSTINYIFDRYRERTKIRHLTPHALRHTCLKKLTDEGAPPAYIAYIAGHFTKSGEPNIRTQMIYTVPTLKDLQRHVDRLVEA